MTCFPWGVVIYEMATGRLPFSGTSPSETVNNILDKDPIPLTKLSPRRPIRLERTVNRLLAKSAENRYQSAEELRERLTGLLRPRVLAAFIGSLKASEIPAIPSRLERRTRHPKKKSGKRGGRQGKMLPRIPVAKPKCLR